jgi:hypothetical protein
MSTIRPELPFRTPPQKKESDSSKWIMIISIASFVAFVFGTSFGITIGSSDMGATDSSELKASLDTSKAEITKLEAKLAAANIEIQNAQKTATNNESDSDRLSKRGRSPGGSGSDAGMARILGEIQDADVVPIQVFKGLQFDPAFVLKVKEFREAKKKFVEDYKSGKVANEIFNNLYKMSIDKALFSIEDDLETANPIKYTRDYNGFNIFKTIPKNYFKKPYDGQTPDTRLDKKKQIVSILAGEASKDYFIIDKNGKIFFNLIRFLAEYGDDIISFSQDNLNDDEKLKPDLAKLGQVIESIKKLKQDLGS